MVLVKNTRIHSVKKVHKLILIFKFCHSEADGGSGLVRRANKPSASHNGQFVGETFDRQANVYWYRQENRGSYWKTTTVKKHLQRKWRQVSFYATEYFQRKLFWEDSTKSLSQPFQHWGTPLFGIITYLGYSYGGFSLQQCVCREIVLIYWCIQ